MFSSAFFGSLFKCSLHCFQLMKMVPPFQEGNYPFPGDRTEVLEDQESECKQRSLLSATGLESQSCRAKPTLCYSRAIEGVGSFTLDVAAGVSLQEGSLGLNFKSPHPINDDICRFPS